MQEVCNVHFEFVERIARQETEIKNLKEAQEKLATKLEDFQRWVYVTMISTLSSALFSLATLVFSLIRK